MRLLIRTLPVALLLLALVAACGRAPRVAGPDVASIPSPGPAPARTPFEATAYSVEGHTATGTRSREGIVAADPKILPLGTRIRVHDAGRYSGVYVVEDTGRAVEGREVDLYLANDREAKRFGRRSVQVEVIEYGGRAKGR